MRECGEARVMTVGLGSSDVPVLNLSEYLSESSMHAVHRLRVDRHRARAFSARYAR
jgi:hypothetical protein